MNPHKLVDQLSAKFTDETGHPAHVHVRSRRGWPNPKPVFVASVSAAGKTEQAVGADLSEVLERAFVGLRAVVGSIPVAMSETSGRRRRRRSSLSIEIDVDLSEMVESPREVEERAGSLILPEPIEKPAFEWPKPQLEALEPWPSLEELANEAAAAERRVDERPSVRVFSIVKLLPTAEQEPAEQAGVEAEQEKRPSGWQSRLPPVKPPTTAPPANYLSKPLHIPPPPRLPASRPRNDTVRDLVPAHLVKEAQTDEPKALPTLHSTKAPKGETTGVVRVGRHKRARASYRPPPPQSLMKNA